MFPKGIRRSAILVGLAVLGSAGLIATISAMPVRRQLTLEISASHARDTPPLIGVGVHFGIGGEYGFDPRKTASALSELGLSTYRDDLPWDMFDWPDPSFYKERRARTFQMMELSGAKPVLIIGHPNPTVADGNPPLNDKGRTAFSDYAGRATEATVSFAPIYEIWNEWNMNAVQGKPWLHGPGDASDPRAAINYTALAKATIPAIRKADPTGVILVGAVGMDSDWRWTKAIVEMGALEGADGLSVHLYNHCERRTEDRTATEMIDRLELLQKFLTEKNAGTPYPIYVTEFGWPTVARPCAITPDTAANNIAQMILWSASAPWLKGAWIYSMKDKGQNPDEMEDNFGLYTYDYRPKVQACFAREAAALVAAPDAKFVLVRPLPDLFVLYGKNKDGLRAVAWTSRIDVKARLSLPGGEALSSRPLCGTPLPKSSSFEIGPTPIVIDLKSERTDLEVSR